MRNEAHVIVTDGLDDLDEHRTPLELRLRTESVAGMFQKVAEICDVVQPSRLTVRKQTSSILGRNALGDQLVISCLDVLQNHLPDQLILLAAVLDAWRKC